MGRQRLKRGSCWTGTFVTADVMQTQVDAPRSRPAHPCFIASQLRSATCPSPRGLSKCPHCSHPTAWPQNSPWASWSLKEAIAGVAGSGLTSQDPGSHSPGPAARRLPCMAGVTAARPAGSQAAPAHRAHGQLHPAHAWSQRATAWLLLQGSGGPGGGRTVPVGNGESCDSTGGSFVGCSWNISMETRGSGCRE